MHRGCLLYTSILYSAKGKHLTGTVEEPEHSDIFVKEFIVSEEDVRAKNDAIAFAVEIDSELELSLIHIYMLRRSHKPVVLVVNKVDSFEKYMTDVYECYNLGIGDPHPISAASMLGLGDMLDEVVKHFPDSSKPVSYTHLTEGFVMN